MTKKVVREVHKKTRLESDYEKLFRPSRILRVKEPSPSLAQPHVLKVVHSVGTYAAYEDPV